MQKYIFGKKQHNANAVKWNFRKCFFIDKLSRDCLFECKKVNLDRNQKNNMATLHIRLGPHLLVRINFNTSMDK